MKKIKSIFDRSCPCDRKEYAIAGVVYAVLLVALLIFLVAFDQYDEIFGLGFMVLSILFVLYQIPWVFINYRRLKTLNKNTKLCMLALLIGIGALMVFLVNINGFVFNAVFNHPVCLYGPPPFEEPGDKEPGTTKADLTNEEPTDEEPTDEEPVFIPETNIVVVMYGPPSFFESEPEELEPYDPTRNWNVDLYGPPPMWEDEE